MSRPPRSVTASSAVPSPYQPGRFARAWDQAKTHGIARSDSMSGASSAAAPARPAATPAASRGRGRAIRSMGVAAPKNAANARCSTSARYAVREMAVSSVIVAVPVAAACAVSRSCSGVEARSAAAVTCSRWRCGDRDVGVVGRDDLALLGELEAAVHRPRRLGEDRAVGRPAAAPDGAATTMEQREADAVPPGDAHQRLLGPVEQPVRGQEPALLGRVRVAQHHLLGVATRPQVRRGTRGPRAARRAARPPRPAPRRTRAAARRRAPAAPAGRSRETRGRTAEGLRHRRRDGPAPARWSRPPGEVVNEMTYRRQASTPKRAWRRAMDRNVASTSATVTPPETSRSGSAPAREGRERGPVDLGVLADLERGEVEPERRQLPAQVGELAVRDPCQPVGDERVLEDRELGVEDGGRRGSRRFAPPSRRSASARVRRRRSAMRAQALAVGLVGEAPTQLADRVGELLGVADERGVEGPVEARRRDAGRDGLHQPARDGLVAAQEVVGLEARCLERHVRGHARVAVPVRPDPRAEPKQRRSRPTGRVPVRPASPGDRPGSPAFRRRARRAPGRWPARSAGSTVNSVSSKIASAERTSSSGVGAMARRSAVCHSRVISSRRRRRRSASSSGVVSGSSRHRAAAGSGAGRPAGSGAAPRWGGRSGPGGPRSARAGPRRRRGPWRRRRRVDRLADGVVDRPAARPAGARAQDPDALPFLGEVDELEVDRERLADGGELRRGRGRRSRRPGARDRRPAPVRSRGRRDGAAIVRRRIRSTRTNSSGPPCSAMTWPRSDAEHPDLATERVAGARQPWARWLGGDRGEPGHPGRARGSARDGRGALGPSRVRMPIPGVPVSRSSVTVRLQGHRPGTRPQPSSVAAAPRLRV